MDSTVAFIIVALILSGNFINPGTARETYECRPCFTMKECNTQPTDYCPYGEVRDACGRRTCGRGPGERCEGPNSIYGRCAEGLRCREDERCHGCAERGNSAFDCYPRFD